MIVCVDPGFANFGYCFGNEDTKRISDFGVIVTSPKDSLLKRFVILHAQITSLFYNIKNISVVVYEEPVFVGAKKNSQLVHYSIAILLMVSSQLVPQPIVYPIAPSTIKKHITGKGNANKKEVLAALKLINSDYSQKNDHVLDAIAIYHTYFDLFVTPQQ